MNRWIIHGALLASKVRLQMFRLNCVEDTLAKIILIETCAVEYEVKMVEIFWNSI